LNRVIEVIVSPTGDAKIETKGFTGNDCRQASATLEQALGTKANERLTTEFHQLQPHVHVAEEGQR
jgi:hypothetical protein